MSIEPITKTEDLAALCRRLGASRYVTVDTEFMREATFWPILCLIQLAGDDDEALIDPLANDLDLAPFFELMANPAVTKVFHSARQDLEIIFLKSQSIPQPLFDTQIAAMVCGFGEQVSFSNLVKRVVGADIDKSSQFTDWSRRPLSRKQLDYALSDVTQLRPVYAYLDKVIREAGRERWLDEELATLMAPETYAQRPEDAWERVKLRVKSRKALGVLIELAAWRERAAQSQDVPRNRVIKDDALIDLANHAPQSVEQLAGLRSIHDGFSRSQRGREAVEAVKRGLALDPRDLPRLERSAPPAPEVLATVELLRVLLKAKAAAHGVAAKLIATTDDLEELAQNPKADLALTKGWRRDVFGDDALRLMRGDIGLAVRNGIIATVDAVSG